jgi:exosortase D (VPLPA-CTERM-specific)
MGQMHEMNLPGMPAVGMKVDRELPETRFDRGRTPSAYRLVAIGVVAALLIAVAYADSLAYLITQWMEDDNYSHGFFIPLVVGALIWMKRGQVLASGAAPSWWGIPVLVGGMGLFVIGTLSTLYPIIYLSLWLVIVALFLSVIGPRATRQVAFPLGYLITMFPLPQMLQQNLSASLQLLSSAFGVGCLQLIGVTAFREGNVIDLGPIQLQVVEACSGLRYLFPLMSLGLLCGYLFQDRLWKRAVLVCSTIPLAIVLNGLRIGVIGLLVEAYGRGAAEGFMHFFEGWVVFVVSLAVLYGEMRVLAALGDRGHGIDRPVPSIKPAHHASADHSFAWPRPLVLCLALLAATVCASFFLQGRVEAAPERKTFLDFPMEIAGWHGVPLSMEKHYVDVLRFDDYLLADFQSPGNGVVNLYVAYYRSQKAGQSAHSPRTCLPGGGWEMTSFMETAVPGQDTEGFHANRVVIQKGDARQIVMYWFKQRERIVTNEYLVKAWLFWDSLTRRRSDGALVRLVAPVLAGEDDSVADRRLRQFASIIEPAISKYVPD